MLRRLSIKARLLVVSILLIAILAASTSYMTANLAANSRAVVRTAELSEIGNLVSNIRNSFGEYRYWLTDLSVSLLRQSELNANATRQRLSDLLNELRPYRPDAAATIDKDVTEFQTTAMKAVEEYIEDRRVVGNTYLAAARQQSVATDERLTSLFDAVNREAMQARNQVLADVVETTRVARIGVALAILIGIGATILVLRSISRPLGDVVASMAAVTAGNLNATIPAVAPDEIGAMARTLGLFRDTMIERKRLAVAESEGNAARDRRSATVALMIEQFRTPMEQALARLHQAAERLENTSSGTQRYRRRRLLRSARRGKQREHRLSQCRDRARLNRDAGRLDPGNRRPGDAIQRCCVPCRCRIAADDRHYVRTGQCRKADRRGDRPNPGDRRSDQSSGIERYD